MAEYSLGGERVAIIIGIDNYKDKRIQTLKGAENDARELAENLEVYGKFKVRSLLLGPNATSVNIRKSISDIFYKNNLCNLVLFYFSGHGLEDGYGNIYIAPYDILKDEPFVCGIRIRDLTEVFSNYFNVYRPLRNICILTILDHCYSGVATKGIEPITATDTDYKKYLEDLSTEGVIAEGVIVLASSGEDQESREIDNCEHGKEKGPHTHGIFTFHLIEGLEGKASDEKGIIRFDNLHNYVEKKMQSHEKQKTKFYVEGGNQIRNVIIAVAQNKYKQKRDEIIKDAQQLLTIDHINPVIQAALKISELVPLEPHSSDPIVKEMIDKINKYLQRYKYKDRIDESNTEDTNTITITSWLDKYKNILLPLIEKRFPKVYIKLFYLEDILSYNKIIEANKINRDMLEAIIDAIDNPPGIDIFKRRMSNILYAPKLESASTGQLSTAIDKDKDPSTNYQFQSPAP